MGARFCSKMDEGGSSQWQLINSIKSAEGGGTNTNTKGGRAGPRVGDIFQLIKKARADIYQHARYRHHLSCLLS